MFINCKDQYRIVVEDQTELICRFLPDFTVIFANEAYCRYIRKSREELIGSNFLSFLTEKEQKIVREKISLLSHENPVTTHEQVKINQKGEVYWQQWNNRAIFDKVGKIIEYQSVERDVTELKKSEEELKTSYNLLLQQKIKLEQKNMALKELIKQVKVQAEEIENKILSNINELIIPVVEKIEHTNKSDIPAYVRLLKENLYRVTSTFGPKITRPIFKLSPRQVEICNMIKNDFSSKQIANILHVSPRTIDIHRSNIRKKLKIAHKKINLATFLRNI